MFKDVEKGLSEPLNERFAQHMKSSQNGFAEQMSVVDKFTFLQRVYEAIDKNLNNEAITD